MQLWLSVSSEVMLQALIPLSFVQKKLDDMKGSGFARIFGNELVYNRFQGTQSLTSGKTFNLLDFLIKLSKDHDYIFTQSLQVSNFFLKSLNFNIKTMTLRQWQQLFSSSWSL